jgi:hypothetical protein
MRAGRSVASARTVGFQPANSLGWVKSTVHRSGAAAHQERLTAWCFRTTARGG